MISIVYIRFRLIDDAHNRNRVYEIELNRDLLGDVTVITRYGRHGQNLREIVSLVSSLEDAQGLAIAALRRRLSARKRLGNAYVLTMAAGECEQLVDFWQKSGGLDFSSKSFEGNFQK